MAYLCITDGGVCAGAMVLPMPAFDAIGHSFATIAIGGFSTHDASVGYFDSPLINTIIAIFLLISGCNYGLHFFIKRSQPEGLLARSRIPHVHWVQLTLVAVCTLVLWIHNTYGSALTTINQAFSGGINGDDRRIHYGQYCPLAVVRRCCCCVLLLLAAVPGRRAAA